jgi:hypothetical protein
MGTRRSTISRTRDCISLLYIIKAISLSI